MDSRHLVEACSGALYDMEGITKGMRQNCSEGHTEMRSDKLSYNAPYRSL